jgi:MoxR-like ATPase
MSSFNDLVATLENASIIKLSPAARLAGLSFRNGLTKAEIVRALREQNLLEKAHEILKQFEQAGERNPYQNTIASTVASEQQSVPAPLTSATLTRMAQERSTASASPLPAPPSIATPAPSQPDPASAQALMALIQRIAGSTLDEGKVRELAKEVAESIYTGREKAWATELGKSLANIVDEKIKTAFENSPRGTVIHIPPKQEPIKLEERQHAQFADLLTCLSCGLNVYLVGQASSGKTHAAENAAKALSRPFYAQGAVTYAHELLGYVDANSKYVRTQFRDSFENGGLMLLDEFDASSPEAALVVNAALANGFCAFPDGMIRRHPDFLCVVGANTDGSGATMSYSGRARLDGAFLDRFVQIEWKIDPIIEKGKAKGNDEWLSTVRAVRKFMLDRKIHDVGATVRAVDFGSTLLAAKVPPTKVLESCLKRGALVAEWAQILRLPEVAEFLIGF